MHIPMGKRLTACVAMVLQRHLERPLGKVVRAGGGKPKGKPAAAKKGGKLDEAAGQEAGEEGSRQVTPRAENTLAERIRRTFAILGYTLGIFGGIGGACYLTMESGSSKGRSRTW